MMVVIAMMMVIMMAVVFMMTIKNTNASTEKNTPSNHYATL